MNFWGTSITPCWLEQAFWVLNQRVSKCVELNAGQTLWISCNILSKIAFYFRLNGIDTFDLCVLVLYRMKNRESFWFCDDHR